MIESPNFPFYFDLEKVDMEKHRRELSRLLRREVGGEEEFYVQDDEGRPKEFNDYFMREHLNDDVEALIKEEAEELSKN